MGCTINNYACDRCGRTCTVDADVQPKLCPRCTALEQAAWAAERDPMQVPTPGVPPVPSVPTPPHPYRDDAWAQLQELTERYARLEDRARRQWKWTVMAGLWGILCLLVALQCWLTLHAYCRG